MRSCGIEFAPARACVHARGGGLVTIYNVTVFLTDPANRSVFHTFNVCGMPPGRVETFGGLEFFMVGSKLYANVMPSDLDGKNTPLNNVEGAEQSASGGASK